MGDSSQTKTSNTQGTSSSTANALTNSRRDPYAPAAPYLTDALGKTADQFGVTTNLATNGALTTGQNAAISNATQAGTTSLANQGMGAVSDIVGGGGLSDAQKQALGSIGSSVGAFNTGQGKTAGYLDPIANGSSLGSHNADFQAALKASLDDARDSVSSSWAGAGRFGSAGMGKALADRLGTVAANATSTQFNQDRQAQLAAIGQLQNGNTAGLSGNLSGAAASAGIGQQSIANKLASIGTIGGLGQAQGLDAATLMGVGGSGWENVNKASSIYSTLAALGGNTSGTSSGTTTGSQSGTGTETTQDSPSILSDILASVGAVVNLGKGVSGMKA